MTIAQYIIEFIARSTTKDLNATIQKEPAFGTYTNQYPLSISQVTDSNVRSSSMMRAIMNTRTLFRFFFLHIYACI